MALLAVRFRVFPIIRKTYFFWAAVSLLNFGFLAFLPFPPLLLLGYGALDKFSTFLLPPALATAAIVLVLTLIVRIALRWKSISLQANGVAPYFVNLAFLVVFIPVSDVYKNHLIENALSARAPSCIYVSSFLSSLMNAGRDFQRHAHAIVVEGGRNYYWSYSEVAFFEGNDSLDPNFSCAMP